MRIEEFIHNDVSADGRVKSGGVVCTTGDVIIGRNKGCSLTGCHCSDGYYISLVLPLTDGIVRGIKVTFGSEEEMDGFLK